MLSAQGSTASRFTELMVTSFTNFCHQQPIAAPTGYGGSTEARAQFLREIVGAIAEVMPLSRVGLRLSPFADYNNALENIIPE